MASRGYRYIGTLTDENGDQTGQWIPGIPARDLSAEELEERKAWDPIDTDILDASPWYERDDGTKPRAKKKADDSAGETPAPGE